MNSSEKKPKNSNTTAIPFLCISVYHGTQKDWEPSTIKVEVWRGEHWDRLVERNDLLGGRWNTLVQSSLFSESAVEKKKKFIRFQLFRLVPTASDNVSVRLSRIIFLFAQVIPGCSPLTDTLSEKFKIIDTYGNLYNIGELRRIACNDNYTPIMLPGSFVLRIFEDVECLADGTWTEIRMDCAKSCPQMFPVGQNYEVLGTDVAHGSDRLVRCAFGYVSDRPDLELPYASRCRFGEYESLPFGCLKISDLHKQGLPIPGEKPPEDENLKEKENSSSASDSLTIAEITMLVGGIFGFSLLMIACLYMKKAEVGIFTPPPVQRAPSFGTRFAPLENRTQRGELTYKTHIYALDN